MNSTHDLLAQVRDRGAGLYAATDLASDHSAVTRRVRRDRTVRTSLFSLAAVVAGRVPAAAAEQARLDAAVLEGGPRGPRRGHSAASAG